MERKDYQVTVTPKVPYGNEVYIRLRSGQFSFVKSEATSLTLALTKDEASSLRSSGYLVVEPTPVAPKISARFKRPQKTTIAEPDPPVPAQEPAPIEGSKEE